MLLKLKSGYAKWIERFLIGILLSLLLITCLKPVPAGSLSIGISSEVLSIGDRSFYINDNEPFGGEKEGYEGITGGFLYPKILEIASGISQSLGQSTTSSAWNLIVISFSGLLILLINRLLYCCGELLGGKRVAHVAMTLFLVSPYTYFYFLSGGITMYLAFGVAFATYCLLFLSSKRYHLKTSFNYIPVKLMLAGSLLWLSSLRPPGILFALVISVILLGLALCNQFPFSKKYIWLDISLLALVICFSLHQLFQTMSYISLNIGAFSVEQGTFFGYPRELLRENISNLANSSFADKLESWCYFVAWKVLDFVTGLVDIRDTHSAAEFSSIFSFIARVMAGIFYLAPLSLAALLFIFTRPVDVISSGLWLPLLASSFALSPSLLGVAMSRYYVMFNIPFLLAGSWFLSELTFSLPRFRLGKSDGQDS